MEKTQPRDAATVSVIIVSDHGAGEDSAWNELRNAVKAWSEQDYDGPVEFIIVESFANQKKKPDDLLRLPPPFRTLCFDAETSYELKNLGAKSANTDIIAVVDADSLPGKNWLRLMMTAMQEHPEVAVVSGRTMYPGRTMVERILCMLLRAYLDPGRKGATRFISQNGAGFRRETLHKYPLPVGVGAFASQLQSEAMVREGVRLLFEPAMTVTHEFEGWPMEYDLRRNHGYGTIITRLKDKRLPYAGLVRLGIPAIPLVAAGKAIHSCLTSLRCWPYYGIRWYQLPVVFLMIGITHIMEIPGMITAYRGLPNPSAFR